jgi:hypothetical protein
MYGVTGREQFQLLRDLHGYPGLRMKQKYLLVRQLARYPWEQGASSSESVEYFPTTRIEGVCYYSVHRLPLPRDYIIGKFNERKHPAIWCFSEKNATFSLKISVFFFQRGASF